MAKLNTYAMLQQT